MASVEFSRGTADTVLAPSMRARSLSFYYLLAVIGLIAALWALAVSRWIRGATRSCLGIARTSFTPSSASSPLPSIPAYLAVLEPVSLRRASERCRSAVAHLRAGILVLWSLFDRGAVAARVRSHRLRASPRRRHRGRGHRLAGPLAGRGLRAGGGRCSCSAARRPRRLQHTGIILTYALFPPALLSLQLALERRSLSARRSLLCGHCVPALALGRNQAALLLLLRAAPLHPRGKLPPPKRPLALSCASALAVLATMAAVGFVLVAPPLLLTDAVRRALQPPRD